MFRRQKRALVLSFLFTVILSVMPVSAAPRKGGSERDRPSFERIVKRLKLAVAALADTISLPNP